ncbi:MAG: response regulator [Phycisphaerae bacterium]|nr:response regulator [Phycisphaerae bacterium]
MSNGIRRLRDRLRLRRQYIAMGITIVSGLLLTAVVFLVFWNAQRFRDRKEFYSRAGQRQEAVYHAMMERLFVLRAVRSMYRASMFVNRQEFALFTNIYIRRVPGIEAIWWIPRVSAENRNEYERLARQDGIESFAFFEHDSHGLPVPVSTRNEYFPIMYAQPLQGGGNLLGFDLGTLPAFRDVMRKARDENQILALPENARNGFTTLSDAIVFVIPVYRQGAPIETVAIRRESLMGFLIGGFAVSDVRNGSLVNQDTGEWRDTRLPEDIHVQLTDETSKPLCRRESPFREEASWDVLDFDFSTTWSAGAVFGVGGRCWVVRCTSRERSLVSTVPVSGIWVLVIGVSITMVMVLYLYRVFHRAEYIQHLVDKRTAELKTEVIARKLAESNLRDSLTFREKLMDISLTGVLTVDPNSRITSVNRALLEMTGYTREELVGRHCSVLSCSACGDHCPLFDPQRQYPIRNSECVVLSKTGRRVSLRKNAEVFRDADGKVVGGVECVVDVTDLYEAKQNAESAVEAKSEFLARMSHEVRTPMNCVLGMTELLRQTQLTKEQKEYATLAQSAAETLMRMINDILDYSKIEAGMLDLECVDFNLRECVGETITALDFVAQQKALELVCDIAPDVPEQFRGDPVRIRQILTNLAGNAVKFTEGGEVIISVEEQTRQDDEIHLLFSVRDTGGGISREHQTRIFNAFEQGDDAATRKYGGVGLGLSIAMHLVQHMGGKVWLESEVGRGSTFSFTLPLKLSSHSPDEGPVYYPKDLADLPVLIVDDNAANRFLLEKILSRWEMRPTLVDNGEEAIRKLKQARDEGDPFPLVLLDVNMPDMDGFEVARKIREESSLNDTILVMLSSLGHRDHAARCRSLGVSAYITKPIRQSFLLSSILEVLNITPVVQKTTLPTGMYPESHQEQLNLRVLLAEDNNVNQILTQNALEDIGCRVTLARNGREAIEIWLDDPHDLILMDLQMPIMDGLEATRTIRSQEEGKDVHVPIIAMTAHALKGDRELCLDAGMDAYVAKPVRGDDLSRTIRTTLQKLRNGVETNSGTE